MANTGPQTIHFRSHALAWQDALPLGNGLSSLLFLGGIAQERLILGHGGCWLPREERRPMVCSLADELPAIRSLLRGSQPQEAERAWLQRCKAAGIRYVGTDSCHPAAGVRIALSDPGEALGYRRWLDPHGGLAGASWHEADGQTWERQAWVDRDQDLVVWRQTAPRPLVLKVTLDDVGADRESTWIASTYPGIDASGWAGHTVPIRDLVRIERWYEDDTAWLSGRYKHGPGGWLVALRVPGATWVDGTAVTPARLNHDLVAVVAADPTTPPTVDSVRDRLHRQINPAAQARAHAGWFDRCRLHLVNPDEDRDTPVEDLLARASDGAVPARLWQHLWAMGRTTFIASTSPEGQYPPHLQGIWSGGWRVPWFGCYTNDENVQMMHWQAVSGNLAPLLRPLRRLIAASRPAWRTNARALFGCRGVLAPLQQGGTNAEHQQAEWQGWTGGAGWLARHVWDAWLMDRDDVLLRDELLPLLREVLEFYEDFLEHGTDGRRHALPSVSVENHPVGWPSRWTIDATMEISIVREAARHAIAAATAAGESVPESWPRLLATLPEYRINADGELAEWIHAEHHDEHQHRHLSHIYPLFPGDEFAPGDSVLRAATARAVAARARLGLRSQTSWSWVHLANIHARLGNGREAQRCLERVVRTCLQNNLLTASDDWRGQGLTMGGGERERSVMQLDALYGAANAMQECLIQSEADHLWLLPALPPAWNHGEARGLGTRCAVVVDLVWSGTDATATITAIRAGTLKLLLGSGRAAQDLRLEPGQVHQVRWELDRAHRPDPAANGTGHSVSGIST